MSSSMRNAIQRRNHKERAQPQSRQKWGLLEKHKDYSLRAADHREKRKHLKILREKARDRNPDEFHFGMMSARTVDGVKIGDRGNKALSHEVVSLLKTQDAAYLRTVLQRTKKEIEKVQGALKLSYGKVDVIGMDGAKKSKTVFVDTVEDQDVFRKAGQDEDQKSLGDDWEGFSEEDEDEDRGQGSKSWQNMQKTLQALKKREAELVIASQELDLQRARMSNSIGGVNKNGVKFKIRERKR